MGQMGVDENVDTLCSLHLCPTRSAPCRRMSHRWNTFRKRFSEIFTRLIDLDPFFQTAHQSEGHARQNVLADRFSVHAPEMGIAMVSHTSCVTIQCNSMPIAGPWEICTPRPCTEGRCFPRPNVMHEDASLQKLLFCRHEIIHQMV